MSDARQVGALLRQYREERCFSQSALATLSGVSRTTISRCESGERLPSLASMDRLAVALELNDFGRFVFMSTDRATVPLTKDNFDQTLREIYAIIEGEA